MKPEPTHPGEVVLEDVIKPLGLTITEAARLLGVTRKSLSELVNKRAGMSAEMALRIAKATRTSPESWLTMQMKVELWKARKNKPRDTRMFAERKVG